MMGDTEQKTRGFFGNFVARTAAILGAVVMLSGAISGCEINLGDSFDNPGRTPNVSFDPVDPTWTQAEVHNRLRLAVSQMSSQSQSLRVQYGEWDSELRRQVVAGQDNTEILSKIAFSGLVQNTQIGMQNDYRRRNISLAKQLVSDRMDGLIAEIRAQIPGPQGQELFVAQLTAFKTLHNIAQRDFFQSGELAALEAEFADARDTILRLGHHSFSASITPSMIFVTTRQLRQMMEQDLPDGIGPRDLRRGLIQQFEDFAQFDAWTNDLSALGFDLTLPRNVYR